MKNKAFIGFIVLAIIIAVYFITGEKTSGDELKEPDLKEVYSVSLENIDFSNEITGLLSEGVIDEIPEYEDVFVDAFSTDSHSNKLLRWGISRNGYNEIPDADPGAPELLEKYGGAYLGDTSQNKIYLTFDEGYEKGYTAKILDALRDNNVNAIFFITGPYLKEHEDFVRRMVEEGHVVGNHTVHHPSLPSIADQKIEEEILGLDRAFYDIFGENMKYLRPPKGEYSERTLAVTKKLGYTNLFWSFAYDDWYTDRIRGKEYAYEKVMNNLHNGAVILLHAVSKDNADAIDMIIKGARERGFEFGDVNDL
ncbi:delta-lactam-biosynthetic de-N-acetylase [Herbivorax sp. ANBcel31]|uniref:delta-lactam-biosynthetic de-N-acetylase n=1 Tax=Herbivorax sp. ANBcel31 TaxID=3069754 RepID=UPI0027B7C3D4|nr:delta-lactam-biosynthetic de-N-acetylase [Herbivorax sp. ANBcel31]MDQ2085977.1 delta-lactam-biosynthetic de-N-acetylase [Herbivorax sp. ANBcel31]